MHDAHLSVTNCSIIFINWCIWLLAVKAFLVEHTFSTIRNITQVLKMDNLSADIEHFSSCLFGFKGFSFIYLNSFLVKKYIIMWQYESLSCNGISQTCVAISQMLYTVNNFSSLWYLVMWLGVYYLLCSSNVENLNYEHHWKNKKMI